MEAANIVRSKIMQMLAKLPGVDKKKTQQITISGDNINIKFFPLDYIVNIYEVCRRIISKVESITKGDIYNIVVETLKHE